MEKYWTFTYNFDLHHIAKQINSSGTAEKHLNLHRELHLSFTISKFLLLNTSVLIPDENAVRRSSSKARTNNLLIFTIATTTTSRYKITMSQRLSQRRRNALYEQTICHRGDDDRDAMTAGVKILGGGVLPAWTPCERFEATSIGTCWTH